MKSLKNNHRRWMVLLLLTAVFNLNMPLVSPASATSRGAARHTSQPPDSEAAAVETPTSYGFDRDGVPFALRSDGTKGRFLHFSSKSVKIEILKGADKVGEAEFRRLSDSQLLSTFTTKDRKTLSVRASLAASSGVEKSPAINLAIRFGKRKVVITGNDFPNEQHTSLKTENTLQAIVTDVKANDDMKRLLTDVQFFGKKTTLSVISPLLAFGGGCGWAVTSCVASLIEYGLGAALIIELCGVTLGAGCLLALAFHPVAGALVARHCSDAITACGGGLIGMEESQT